ncbi:hypothetical protein SGFS_057250 [Streptomyces graminofaciens]|uniref:Uncharacterized protein n=1 Tax=Streptomyces graminofaciens TaxID=68212 RepID=A0ABN5VMW5_9ACTN|nr:hypothetical protein [Streptomyces graminofaciens]BBC34431.1 hypothetical protein SGFS_057250 [Streptomyces graminofaciens]
MSQNPYPYPYAASQQDALWWLVPVVCTPLALVFGYFDYVGSLIGSAPDVWKAAGYVVAFGMVAGSWLLPRTRAGRDWRIGMGVTGCVLAAVYGKVASAVVIAAHVVMWLQNGD